MKRHRSTSNTRYAQGFTLIELMVALVLGLLVIAGVSAIFLGGSRNYREDERVARMHDNTRFALAELTHEIEMGGHWAEQFFPPDPVPHAATVDPTAGTDCGPGTEWKYVATPAIEILDNVTGAGAAAAFSCIAAADVVPGTDIISIKRLAGSPSVLPIPDGEPGDGAVYFRTNNSAGTLLRDPPNSSAAPASDPAIAAVTGTTADWAYQVTIYYIRNYFTPGDGIPSLCREVLQGINVSGDTGGCIPGIENLQLEAGIDTDADGVANYYTAAPDSGLFDQIVGVRALLLSRTAERLSGYTNPKTYALSNLGNVTPGDNYPRELTTATVLVRNTSSLSQFTP